MVSLVARPRNQRYLQPVTACRGGLLAARTERQNAGEIAGKLDLEMSVLWHEANLVDEIAQSLGGGAAGGLDIE